MAGGEGVGSEGGGPDEGVGGGDLDDAVLLCGVVVVVVGVFELVGGGDEFAELEGVVVEVPLEAGGGDAFALASDGDEAAGGAFEVGAEAEGVADVRCQEGGDVVVGVHSVGDVGPVDGPSEGGVEGGHLLVEAAPEGPEDGDVPAAAVPLPSDEADGLVQIVMVLLADARDQDALFLLIKGPDLRPHRVEVPDDGVRHEVPGEVVEPVRPAVRADAEARAAPEHTQQRPRELRIQHHQRSARRRRRRLLVPREGSAEVVEPVRPAVRADAEAR
eukprot:CAMPEP_0118890052 /NCGR_PEP_ID=MMETSP1166-20130328/701_1 /TAXON_ID=1104430 /ORGANISM="Chrysoreinhardia sp, Strain CCMP3193" /LENGTH=273 /DNA_ID=CAMNT_0006828653 /DNA_START=90 /DNA_END=908 /DNA_ORIENTATION=+